jgi:hypothetical protein
MNNPTTSRKSLKSFNVRDGLWKLFEVRAQEMDCSVDYLINEAMRLYARTHNFAASVRVDPAPTGVTTTPGLTGQGITGSDPGAQRPITGVAPVRPSMAPVPHPTIPKAPPLMGASASATSIPAPLPAPPPIGQGAPIAPPKPPSYEPTNPAAGPRLTLIFQGRKIPVTSQQFIVGRGSKSSDLAIKDPNISRKHAAVIFHNGAYYIKDLGSTNGVEYKGKTVDSKRIDEGDVFSICGYDLHFTYSV